MKHIPEIQIKFIPHKKHRYETVGDYFTKNGVWNIRVSKWKPDYEFAVAIHELVEKYFTQKHGIKEKDISKFDIKFNEGGKDGEPGDEKDAPYRKEHKFATKVEHMIIKELGYNIKKYKNTFHPYK